MAYQMTYICPQTSFSKYGSAYRRISGGTCMQGGYGYA